MRPIAFCCVLSVLCGTVFAAARGPETPVPLAGSPAWPEGTGAGETFALWPSTNSIPLYSFKASEQALRRDNVTRLQNVSVPALKFYPAPQPPATGHQPPATSQSPATSQLPAMIVCPGGGYFQLGMDKEGSEIAAFLNTNGLHAFVLKYRVPGQRDAARCDVQRAISFVRANAARFNVDPRKIGVMGFSAGGHLTGVAATSWPTRAYPAADAIDAVSCRPDFVVLIYPAFLEHSGYGLSPSVSVPTNMPPCFIFQTELDKYGAASLAFACALRTARQPFELHIAPGGGHGYGARTDHRPSDAWPSLLATWFDHVVFSKPY